MKRSIQTCGGVVAVSCLVLGAMLGVWWSQGPTADAHCQIPCGLYDDATEFKTLTLHVATIEKSMKQIVALSKSPAANANQLARWVQNKEAHADRFAASITNYFLQQRIKPTDDPQARSAYLAKLELCHKMLVTAMKCKQTTDLEQAKKLGTLLATFEKAYSQKTKK